MSALRETNHPRKRVMQRDGMYWQADAPPFHSPRPEEPPKRQSLWTQLRGRYADLGTTLIDSALVLACMGIIAVGIWMARALGGL